MDRARPPTSIGCNWVQFFFIPHLGQSNFRTRDHHGYWGYDLIHNAGCLVLHIYQTMGIYIESPLDFMS